jgi:hypothetical protein
MKRLMMLDYENIVIISHEDTSKDITKKSGDKITSIRPNIREKVANKIAGMVDIVARVVANGDERTLEFKQNEVVFGGGRLTSIKDTVIPLDYEEFLKVYNQGKEEKPTRRKTEPVEEQEENVEEETKTEVVEEDAPVEEVVTRTRRRKRA